MAPILFYLIVTFLACSPMASANRTYFDYNDCTRPCVKPFCLIFPTTYNTFNILCADEHVCLTHYTPHAVCLRPNKPPLGGEAIWSDFRKLHPDPEPTPPKKCNLGVATIISLISNILFLLTIFVQVTRSCLRRSSRKQDQQIPNALTDPLLDSISTNSD